MKPAKEVMKKMGVRTSNDFEKVFADFPIGHTVTVNEQSAVVFDHTEMEIFGTHCLWVKIKFYNGDWINVDPYFFNLVPKKSDSKSTNKKTT